VLLTPITIEMDTLYVKKWIFLIAMVVLVIGGLNWLGVGVRRVNLLELVVGRQIARIVYIAVGIAALWIMFDRDTYLPFLGETVFPCSALAEQTPRGADTTVQLQVPAGRKVIYWASEPDKEHLKSLNNWRLAYLKYENVGVATADAQGLVALRVRKPQAYSVPMKGRIEPHIHYRVCGGAEEPGLLGRIQTVYLDGQQKEGFLENGESDVEGQLLY
jgi:uncharacterized protein